MKPHSGRIPVRPSTFEKRGVWISALAVGVALIATGIAQILTRLIGLVTNLAFYHRLSLDFSSPADAPGWGPWVIVVPAIGGVLVGLMARYGSKAIRGHGIPEAMEQVLLNQSRIPVRMTFLKPLSAAIAIGTGGPFGAEGPIIATGGALGSALGQALPITSIERKTLLAAGAAAGMSAIFGSPVSAVLLAVELLLFEFRPRTLIPVALAAATAAAARIPFSGSGPVFTLPELQTLQTAAIGFYIVLGLIIGVASVAVTRLVYAIEDAFEHLPIHWMWWPALGGLAVGLVGYFFPRTLGVGYDNIDAILSGGLAASAVLIFCVMKLISWSISLGSGTSGGTLAPLLTIGGGIGLAIGKFGSAILPAFDIDPKVAALVGMAGLFAGASRALLASIVFAFEITQQPHALLPLLGGCTTAFLVSCLLMKNSIMTEKIARRGVLVPSEYEPDHLDHATVHEVGIREVRTLADRLTLGEAKVLLSANLDEYAHQGFPVLGSESNLIGVITRREILTSTSDSQVRIAELITRSPIFVRTETTLREATNLMAEHEIGRLPVLSMESPPRLVGIITRRDLIRAKHLNT